MFPKVFLRCSFLSLSIPTGARMEAGEHLSGTPGTGGNTSDFQKVFPLKGSPLLRLHEKEHLEHQEHPSQRPGEMGAEMTWLDRLLVEDRAAMVPEMASEVEAVPRCDRWAGPLFDPALEPPCSGLPQEEIQTLREERAGILEFQAGLPRPEAERRAWAELPMPP